MPAPTPPPFLPRSGPRRGWRGLVLPLLLLLGSLGPSAGGADEPETMRFGFSDRMFDGVNLNDARASMKVWAQKVATDQGVPVSPDVLSYPTWEAIRDALDRGEVEAVTVCADEFYLLRDQAPIGTLILSDDSGQKTEEFLLLVREDRGIKRLADLRGKSLTYQLSARATIIRHWLQAEQLAGGLPGFASFWRQTKADAKLAKVILPVFFGQIDACLVTRSGFEIMAELNPQVGRQLVPIARSGPVISSVFFFRSTYNSDNVDRIVELFTRFGQDPAAQQILTLFQQNSLSVGQDEDLAPTLRLLDRYFTLTREAGATPVVATAFPTP